MNLYAIAFIALGVIVFAWLTGMTEPFGLIRGQFTQVMEPIKENNLAYNTAILVLVVIGLSAVGNWLFRRRNNGEEERDRFGDRSGDEASSRIPGEVPRQETTGPRRRA